jgi:hypothetical protein
LFSRRFFWVFLFLGLAALRADAHIGNPNVFFEGHAGPYPIRVTIQPPMVVPGLAQIHVRLQSDDVQKVTVLPVKWNAGTKGAPPADVAKPVPGETNLLTAQLWLMDSGAYSVFVDVYGSHGRGTAIVPLDSLAYKRLGMSQAMSFGFLAAGAVVFCLLVSLIGAAARESVVAPGETPDSSRKWKARVAMTITAVIAVTALALGKWWWDAVDRDYRFSRLYRPESLKAEAMPDGHGGRQLALYAALNRQRMESTPLVPEHGHIMHLFLVRQPEGDAFAHLHPISGTVSNLAAFTTPLPALPAGDYQVFADITHESGLTQTLTNTVRLGDEINTNSAPALADADDSVDLSPPQTGPDLSLPGGFKLAASIPAGLRPDQDITLRFNITAPDGKPATLEPYLGMYGHLIIESADGTVFNHLHPLGSISMTAQRAFAQREQASYLANQPLDQFCSTAEPVLSFPYAFPKAGNYRLWLQTKIGGRICTGAYAVTVQ